MIRNNHNINSEFWPVYKNLEKEVLALTYEIHFTDITVGRQQSQIGVYSNKIAEHFPMRGRRGQG